MTEPRVEKHKVVSVVYAIADEDGNVMERIDSVLDNRPVLPTQF